MLVALVIRLGDFFCCLGLLSPNRLLLPLLGPRASIGPSQSGAIYMTIKNVSREPVMLTGIEADIAMMSEVHETLIDAAAVASMSPAGAIEIPAGETVIFAPFGRHIMLMNLLRPMEEGTRCLLTLYFW